MQDIFTISQRRLQNIICWRLTLKPYCTGKKEKKKKAREKPKPFVFLVTCNSVFQKVLFCSLLTTQLYTILWIRKTSWTLALSPQQQEFQSLTMAELRQEVAKVLIIPSLRTLFRGSFWKIQIYSQCAV